jgi:hypothetical protein
VRTFRIFLVMIVLLLICQPAFSQSHDTGVAKKSKSDLMLKSGKFKPFLEFAYGFSTPRYEGIDASFAQLGMADFKVGYSSDDSLKYNLISSDQHFAFVSFLNDNLSSSGGAEVDEIGSEMTRFGFGNRRAYGYGGSGLKIEMYNQDGLDWTKVSPTSYETMDEDVQDMFDHFGSTYRFGMLTEAGLRVKVTQSFSLIGGAEGGVVMPRTVFWPWLGSVAIYSAVQGGLEKFSANIIEASPTAGPVIAFLLKTGVSAGYYYLLRDDMNWPFGYEAPLTVSSFKVGANFTF